ncbi:MAG: protoporphyrinogen oxidase [Thermoplasmataceae archaeon]
MEIAVIGGGISGLSTCYYLEKLSKESGIEIHVSLLESGNRLGGKVLTRTENGLIIDAGPDSFFTQKPWALELCSDLGLSGDLTEANAATKGTFILNSGKLSRLPEGTESGMPTKLRPFVSTDLISFGGKFRALMDLVIPRKSGQEDESIGSFMGRRFGKEFLVKIVEPLYAGIYAGDVNHLSVRSSLQSLVALESEHGSLIRAMSRMKKKSGSGGSTGNRNSRRITFVSLKGGMEQLTDSIQKNLKSTKILLDTTVQGIIESKRAAARKFRISLVDGEHMDADAVVLSVPAYAASSILIGMDSRISTILDTIPYVSTAVVSVAYRKTDIESATGVKGHGFLVPRTEDEIVTGCTWESLKWPIHAPGDTLLARCYVGWFGHEEFRKMDDASLTKSVLDFLGRTAGISARPKFTKVFRWENALPQYTVGHIDRMSQINKLLLDHPGLYFTGSAYHGVGLPDCIHDAYLTAKEIMDYRLSEMRK